MFFPFLLVVRERAKERMAEGGGDKKSDSVKQKSGMETVPHPVKQGSKKPVVETLPEREQGKARDIVGKASGLT